MRRRARQVHVWVTSSQRTYMKSKAESYGITLTQLVLLAVEAYTRTYEGNPEEGALAAVNYGVWNRVDDDLAKMDEGLRLAVRQLNGMRRAIVGHGDTIERSANEREHMLDIIESCRSTLRSMHDDVARCTAILEHVCDATHLVDPYLGPMEGVSTADTLEGR